MGFSIFLWKVPVNVLGPILTSFVIEFGTLISGGFYIYITKKDFKSLSRSMWKYILLISLGGVAGSIFFNMGIKNNEVSIVAPITFASPLVVALYGKFVYKEELSKLQYLAIFFIVLGVILVSYLSK